MPDDRAVGLMAELTETEAVARCRAGNDPGHAAFRILYDLHEAEVRRFLARLIGDRDAVEDALQNTFVRLYRGLARFDATRPLRPYVLSIARNVAIDAMRARKKTDAPPIEAAPRPDARDAIDVAAGRERDAAIEDALGSLAAEHRSIIVMRFTHGLKQEEIAESLSCTVRTVRNRLRAASMLFERELARRGIVAQDETDEVLS